MDDREKLVESIERFLQWIIYAAHDGLHHTIDNLTKEMEAK